MKVIVQKETTLRPLELMGREAGVCYNSNIDDEIKNFKRGIECVKTNHGRLLEFPQVYLIIDGYSAKVMREFYTHIGGSPTRTQASTRYIEYGDFDYVTPNKIACSENAKEVYDKAMSQISDAVKSLEYLGIPKEDSSMLLPLGMTTKVVVRTNLRNLIDMSKQRMCTRAYHEYRKLMNDILNELAAYSIEWGYLINELKVFHPKCDDLGYCPEKKPCSRHSDNK